MRNIIGRYLASRRLGCDLLFIFLGLCKRCFVIVADKLCFVILNYKQSEYVISNVKRILKIYPRSSIVIIDNNSSDGSLENITHEFMENTNVKIYGNEENTGYAKGNNLGVQKAKEAFNPEYVAIMNPDVELIDDELVPKILKAFENHPDLALCSGVMLNNKRKLDYTKIAWKVPDKLDDVILNIPFLGSRLSPIRYTEYSVQDNGLAFVDVIPGSFFVVRLKHFKSPNIFDDGTFLYCEERILGRIIKKRGLKTGLVMTNFYLHNHSYNKIPGLRQTLLTYSRLVQSRIYYNMKYNSWPKIIVMPPLYLSSLVGFLLTIISWPVKVTIRYAHSNKGR